tara:strand:- start:8445 stop:10472 length:2028 start_codon:yes stop_codon:yes gene_type:complete
MLKVKVNDIDLEVEEGLTVLQACEQAGAEIPRFCYHEKLSIAGNCRMCLVEIEKSPKPVASCAMPVANGMNIKTNTKIVEKARKGVMEFLLANHPLDCPVCDQGGECDLQDQSMFYGVDKSRYKENKRHVPEKYMGPLIKTQMTRCIHCTRCIRFATEVAGVPELGAIGRGEDMQITTYLEKSMESELSANVIDLCPVGALTSKPYVFEARPWELKKTETIDVMDAIGSNIRVDTLGWEVKRILPRVNEDINGEWISDKTRYSCDGLKNQRLDSPYIKEKNKLIKVSWEDAYKKIVEKINNTSSDKIAGFIGDLTNMETSFAAKEFFNQTIKCSNLESREDYYSMDINERNNYIFNSKLNGIEDSDLIVLVGTNPRFEATILNSRIRIAAIKNNCKIYSFGDLGNLTYDYEILENKTSKFKEIFEKTSSLTSIIENSKKPIFIFGQSFFKLKSSNFLLTELKKYLRSENKIDDDWNPINILSKHASTVGSYDLNIISGDYNKNDVLNKILNNNYELIFLFGQDNLKISKKNEFIVYIGSHGDYGAEISDVILPGAAFTEQTAHYTNLEGRVQKSYQASYPPGDAKEDWEIINNLSQYLKRKKIYNNKDNLVSNMFDYIKNCKNKSSLKIESMFHDEKINVDYLDYYYSNVISRASKTMSECRNLRNNDKKTGTEG